jgi:hypothetical protein
VLAQIAAQTGLGLSSLRHIKAFSSGAFKQAKRLGILARSGRATLAAGRSPAFNPRHIVRNW